MNEDNRRQHPRSETDHPATLFYQSTTLPDCRILNFSLGGLYIENRACDFPTLVNAAEPQPGGPDSKHALIEIPNLKNGGEAFSVAVKLAFVSSLGAGISFLQPNTELCRYFQSRQRDTDDRLSFAKAPAAPPVDSRIKGRIVRACQRFLGKHLPAFFEICELQLPEQADQAATDQIRTDLFHAQQLLQREAKRISSAQVNHTGSRLEQLLQSEEAEIPSTGQLSISQEMELIAKDEFEEWVVIIGLGHAVESEMPRLLHDLEMGLSYLLKRPVSNDTNPISPAFLLWTLCNELSSIGIQFPVRRILYDLFRQSVLSHVDELYRELEVIFGRHGVDTKVVSIKAHSAQPGGSAGSKPSRPAQKRSMIGRLSALVTPRQDLKETDDERRGRPRANRHEILGTLDNIHGRSDRPIVEQIARSLANERQKQLDGTTRGTIAATGELVASLQQDQRLGIGLQRLIKALEIPVVREALANEALLDDSGHLTRQIFEHIDQLAPYMDADAAVDEPLLQIIDQLGNASAEQNQEQLLNTAKEIEQLLSSRRKTFDRNLALVISSSRQNDTNSSARQRISNELTNRLDRQSAAKAIVRLLDCGWVGLLNQCALLGSDGEKRLHVYLSAIDFMLKLFPPDTAPMQLPGDRRDKLIALLKRGFSEYPVHAKDAYRLIEELEQGLIAGGEQLQSLVDPRVEIDTACLGKLLDEQVPGEQDNHNLPLTDSLWGKRLETLTEGDWIVQKRDDGQVRLLNLAWRNGAKSRFVFVDGNGNKVIECDAVELERRFSTAELSQLESRELPMVERAVERMMQNTFSRVERESRKDDLTGLLNRRAFAQKIDELRLLSQHEGSHHALIILDLDQFAMVNDLCGYEGGDQLLKEVSSIITSYQHAGAVLARTGDDEFGILLQDITVDKGFQAAETQRKALEAYHFNWEQQAIPVSVSIGIVAIDNTAESAQRLLKDASSACDLAKQSGRNCSRVFQLSDEQLQLANRLIRSVPVIEEALANNRISLHGQLITPLFIGEGSDHYEVLLRVTDADGRPTDPGEFISAAERYDRMRSVDRWIINSFFTWAGDNRAQIDNIAGFSLNISGQSVMDPTFRAFLLQHLANGPLAPEQIGFEVTETAAVKSIDQVNDFIREIQRQGSKFYLDDFGSGYASYSYLKDLAVDCVKIDGVFVKDMLEEKSSHAMVKSITEIAHHMDKKVVAEYVESEAHIIALREIGVDYAQGYGVGIPQPLSTILQAAVAYG